MIVYRRWKVYAASAFGERSGPKWVRVPERLGAREGNRNGRSESLEATERGKRRALLHGFDDALRRGQARGLYTSTL